MNSPVSPTSPPRLPVVAGQPSDPTDVALYRQHFARLTEYTDRLREGRCRRTRRFDEGLAQTMAAFQPLFAPWNMQILFVLYMHGPQRFNALKRTMATISSRVLTDKLRHLASENLIVRTEAPVSGYGLTAEGNIVARHLHPLLFHLHNMR
jgi:DNA-binding HxlR family transcriptional regulator